MVADAKAIFPKNSFIFWFTFYLCFGILYVGISASFEFSVSRFFGLFFINFLIICVGIARCVSTWQTNPLSCLVWSFQYVFFGLTPLAYEIDPNPYYLFSISEGKISKTTIWLVLMSSVLLLFNQFVIRSHEMKSVAREFPTEERFIFAKKLLFIAWVTSLPITLKYLGGINNVFRLTRYSGVAVPSYGSPLYSISEAIFYLIPSLLLTLDFLKFGSFRQALNKKSNKVALIGILLISNPFGNSRQLSLYVLMPVLVALIYTKTIHKSYFTLAVISFFVFFASSVDRFTGDVNFRPFTVLSRNGDFDAIYQLNNGVYLYRNGIFDFGEQILGSLLFFVPRSIWQNKPLDTGVVIAREFGLHFQNLSAPLILEFFINFSWLGLVVWFAFFRFMRNVDSANSGNLRWRLLSCALSSSIFIVMRGSLLQASGKLFFAVCLSLVISMLIYQKPIVKFK